MWNFEYMQNNVHLWRLSTWCISLLPLIKLFYLGIHRLPDPVLNDDGHFECFEQVFGTETDERSCPSVEEAKQKVKKRIPFNTTQQRVKNVNMVVQCEECEMWRIVYSKKRFDSKFVREDTG